MPAGASLIADLLSELCSHLRSAREDGLAAMPVAAIVAAVDRAVVRWGDPVGAERGTAVKALAETTGYHPAMVAWALDDLSRAFRAPALERLLQRELHAPLVLDRFVARPDGGGATRAYGPGLTVIVLSGNVFHVAAESMILALLAKSACLVKTSARDPLFPVLFARSLAAEDARIAAALAVADWPGGDAEIEVRAFGTADAVIAYGGAEAVTSVRARTPAHVRLIEHGPKISFAVVQGDAAGSEAAALAAARDVSLFDQQGCVSPHTVYVEGVPDGALGFARLLARAMAELERALPRAKLPASEAAAIIQARGSTEFRPGAEVFADAGSTAWTVIFDSDPAFGASCLNRVVYVKPLPSLGALPALLEPVQPYLQTGGVAGDGAFRVAVATVVGPLGVARVCPLGRMQHPPADWRHDGRPRLLDLLRWTDLDDASAIPHA